MRYVAHGLVTFEIPNDWLIRLDFAAVRRDRPTSYGRQSLSQSLSVG